LVFDEFKFYKLNWFIKYFLSECYTSIFDLTQTYCAWDQKNDCPTGASEGCTGAYKVIHLMNLTLCSSSWGNVPAMTVEDMSNSA